MSKIKRSLMGGVHKDPIKKKTTQGNGQHSKAKKGQKLLRGQGR